MSASPKPSDDDKVEVLLFDIGVLHKSVHESARVVCSQRGIPLRLIDLTYFEDESQSSPPHEGMFPQAVLLQGSKVLGRNYSQIHTPKTFSIWLNGAFDSSPRPIDLRTVAKQPTIRREDLHRKNGNRQKGKLDSRQRQDVRQLLTVRPSQFTPYLRTLHAVITGRGLPPQDGEVNNLNFR
jgi:hypothetical protein